MKSILLHSNGSNNRAWRQRQYGQLAADAIDNAVRELIYTAFKRATDILQSQLTTLDKAASYLLSKETVSADELKNIIHDSLEPTEHVRKPTLAVASGANAERAAADR